MTSAGHLREEAVMYTAVTRLREPGAGLGADVLRTLDWEYVLEAGRRHGVVPMLAVAFAPHFGRGVPVDVAAALTTTYETNRVRNRWVFQEAERLLGALGDRGVDVIALKGLALARYVYPDPAVRAMTDLDLLVEPAAVDAARQTMEALGYRATPHDPPPDHHLVPYVSPHGIVVEVHWKLVPDPHGFAIDHERLRAAARREPFGRARAWILAPEDFLWQVAVHASFQHGFRQSMRCVADMAALLDAYGAALDWPGLRARARATRVWPYLASMLYVLRCVSPTTAAAPEVDRPPRPWQRLVARGTNAERGTTWIGRQRARIFRSLDISPYAETSLDDARQLYGVAESCLRMRGAW